MDEKRQKVTAADLRARIAERVQRLAGLVDAAKRSDEMRTYLAFCARFHRYSFNNVMLICAQRPGATHVAGYKTWQKLGRQVRKGERGIAILAPVTFRRRDPETGEETGETGLTFRTAWVFDVSQTEGDPLPEVRWLAEGQDGAALADALRAYAASLGIAVRDADTGGAGGVSKGGAIDLSADLTPLGRAAVLAHELAHELLHRDPAVRATTTRAQREHQAEAVAYVVLAHFGHDLPSSGVYLALWDADAATLQANLEAVQRAAGQIIGALEAPVAAHDTEG